MEREWDAHKKGITDLAVGKGGGTVVTACVDEKRVKVWDMSAQGVPGVVKEINEFEDNQGKMHHTSFAVAISPDGENIAMGGGSSTKSNGLVKVYEVRSWEIVAELIDLQTIFVGLVFSRDGNNLFTALR